MIPKNKNPAETVHFQNQSEGPAEHIHLVHLLYPGAELPGLALFTNWRRQLGPGACAEGGM